MEIIVIFLVGIIAGILGGLLGIGGGIILMPLLRFFIGLPPSMAAGTCVMAVFFTTLGGSFGHYKLGHIKFRSLIPVIISGAISTVIFSFIFISFSKRENWLDFGIGLVFFLVSIRMIAEGILDYKGKITNYTDSNEIQGSIVKKISIGSIAGILPGLLGIGTGAILVTAYKFILKAPIKIAIGSSLICFAVNAFLSACFKIHQGFIDIKIALIISAGALIGANIGAVINKKFPSVLIKLLFGLLFIIIAVKYIRLF